MMTKRMYPGKAARCVSFLLALMLTFCIIMAGLTGLMAYLFQNRTIHDRVVSSPEIRTLQLDTINNAAKQLADEYGFDPAYLTGDVTEEELNQFNRDAVSWWLGLINGAVSLNAPEWPTGDMVAAIKADEGFAEAHPEMLQDVVINTKIVSRFTKALRESVLPVRSNIVSFGAGKVLGIKDYTLFTAMVPWLPLIFGLLGLVMAGLMLLVCAKKPALAVAHMCAALAAAGFLLCTLFVVLCLVDVKPILYSQVLTMQAKTLMNKLALPLFMISDLLLIGGLAGSYSFRKMANKAF
ncbi:MAG: hypothetical protein Q4C54_00140 [Clostridia bacterium]|nr:hypothetical protein [Clostridia bacterium]